MSQQLWFRFFSSRRFCFSSALFRSAHRRRADSAAFFRRIVLPGDQHRGKKAHSESLSPKSSLTMQNIYDIMPLEPKEVDLPCAAISSPSVLFCASRYSLNTEIGPRCRPDAPSGQGRSDQRHAGRTRHEGAQVLNIKYLLNHIFPPETVLRRAFSTLFRIPWQFRVNARVNFHCHETSEPRSKPFNFRSRFHA